MKLLLRNIELAAGSFTLRLDLELKSQVTGIVGPSGAGKTSLLDLIAGLRTPRSACIQLDEQVLTDTAQRFELPTRKRQLGYVPQDLALFPHLTVKRNILYGCKRHRNSDSRFDLDHVVEVLAIGSLLDRAVTNLSGGEKQRVTLARALLSSPKLLLLDEPLASLDEKLKRQVLPYFRLVRDEFRIPMIYVAHNPEEIQQLCEEVLVLERGSVIARELPGIALPPTQGQPCGNIPGQ